MDNLTTNADDFLCFEANFKRDKAVICLSSEKFAKSQKS